MRGPPGPPSYRARSSADLESVQLFSSYLEAKPNRGVPGPTARRLRMIEARAAAPGSSRSEPQNCATARTSWPYRRREFLKEGGRGSVLSIPTSRAWVVEGALRLLLEPISSKSCGRSGIRYAAAAPLGAGYRRTREPDRERVGELLPRRQLDPRVRGRARRRRAQGQAVRG